MGVIKRQGIKNSIVRYAGLVIGTFNVLYFYPLFLGAEKLGIINFIVSTALLAHTFMMLGGNGIVVKFFPQLRNQENNNNFLTFMLLWVLAGILLFLCLTILLKPVISDLYEQKADDYLTYLPYILLIAIAATFQSILKKFASVFGRIVVPTFLEQLYKVVIPLLAYLYYLQKIPFDWLIQGIVVYYAVVVVLLLSYTHYLGRWKISLDFSAYDKPLLKKIFNYAGYAVFGSIGGILAFKIDSFMVATLTSYTNNGIYSVATFIATVIRVPYEGIVIIASPIISTRIQEKDWQEVNTIYKRSSILLGTAGLFILLGIWSNIDNLFRLMPNGEDFAEGKYVVLILGISIVMDMLTSVNGDIIGYSKYFRFNFYAILLLAILNIFSNLYFIPRFDINGAALATAISLLIFNTVKVLFIYIKFQLFPFSRKTFLIILITLVIYFLLLFVPSTSFSFFDIIIKSALVCLLFIPTVLYFEISSDLNDLWRNTWQIILNSTTK